MSKLQKGLTFVLVALFVITAIFVVLFYIQVVPLADETAQIEHSITDGILGWAVALFGIAAVAAVAFPILDFAQDAANDIKSVIKPAIALVAVAVILVIAYATASGSMDSLATPLQETEETIKWSGAGLNALYITLGLSIVAVIFVEVKNIIK